MEHDTCKPAQEAKTIRSDRGDRPGRAFFLSDEVVNETAEHVEARIRTLEIEGQVALQASNTWKQKSEEAFARAGEIRDLFRKAARA